MTTTHAHQTMWFIHFWNIYYLQTNQCMDKLFKLGTNTVLKVSLHIHTHCSCTDSKTGYTGQSGALSTFKPLLVMYANLRNGY